MIDNGDIFWAAFGGGAAAGVFTLLAVILAEWFRWFLDRPLLKVTMMFAHPYNVPGFDPTKTYISFEARNPHTKPITLASFGFYFKNPQKWGKIQVQPDGLYQFPYELQGGKAIFQVSPEDDSFQVLLHEGRKPSDLKCVYFQSQSGKLFCGNIPRVSMKVLEKHFVALKDRI